MSVLGVVVGIKFVSDPGLEAMKHSCTKDSIKLWSYLFSLAMISLTVLQISWFEDASKDAYGVAQFVRNRRCSSSDRDYQQLVSRCLFLLYVRGYKSQKFHSPLFYCRYKSPSKAHISIALHPRSRLIYTAHEIHTTTKAFSSKVY